MLDQIARIVRATGWQREVVEYLYQQHQESGGDGDFLDTLADAYGSATFISAADAGMSLNSCKQAYEVGIELKTVASPIVDVIFEDVLTEPSPQAALTEAQ